MFKTSPAAQNPDGFSTNPTAANCSQPLKQPKVQLDSKQNPTRCKLFTPPPSSSLKSRWTLHKTLPLQTIHNLRSSPTGPAEFATKHRTRKLFTTFPAAQGTAEFSTKTYFCKLFATPTFPRVQQDCQPHPAPASSTQPTQTKPYPASCFQPSQKPKVKTEHYIHPRYSPGSKSSAEFPEPTVFAILVKLIEESSVPAVV